MKLLVAIALLAPPAPDTDSLVVKIESVVVTASAKLADDHGELPAMATSLGVGEPGSGFVLESKDLSLRVPNMLHADYGSRMTGSIYIRGLGSRMDNPAIGLYVDDVPILNKNNYDFDYFELRRIDVLGGPQGTLYGRNTIGGVIDVHTLSPFEVQGVRLGAGYGSGNSWHARGAAYLRPTQNFGISLAVSHRSTDGFFTNAFDGSRADRGHTSAARLKVQARLSERWTLTNSLYANLVQQGGFAYAHYDEQTGRAGRIDHNDPCSYDRLGIVEGLTFRYTGREWDLSATTSWQYTDDDMVLDNDFSPRSMFTLRQSQLEHAFTHEVVARSTSARRWQWIAGLFGFYRHLDMRAPVVFKRDGIDELILANANAGIDIGLPPADYPDADLEIEEQSFPIRSDFRLPAWGFSLYHQSTFEAGRWRFIAGLRADWEHTAITYANSAEIHYRFTMTMPGFKPLPVEMRGERSRSFFEVMPRAAVMLELGVGNIYASVARGYKAGGYNTQIFSDIVQNRMMNDLMADLGIYLDGVEGAYDAEDAISYEPEYSWNYEAGGHFSFADGRLTLDAALFYIDCRNQQLAVFPPGKGTGRLMSNAGQTRSFGAELSAAWRVGGFRVAGGWGCTDARFISYDDGHEDYSGNHVPYAPQSTLSVQCEYSLGLGGKEAGRLIFGVGLQRVGRIRWNEANTISQQPYGLLNASLGWQRERFNLSVWASNLAGADFDTFYFKSVGRSFVQRGKPLQAGVTVSLNL